METKIKVPAGYTFKWKLIGFLNQVLVLCGLRKHREFWGIIYDSVTKQPLDPVIVKMAYVQTGRVVETCVTDLEGRYGFLARPGKFKIFAQKTNYQFPSTRITKDRDGIFDDLYHGEFFQLDEDAEVIAPNIPMDPIAQDWNQQAKEKVVSLYYHREYLVRSLVIVLVTFGFIFLAVFAIFQPSIPAYAGLGGYVLLFLFSRILPEVRLWGVVVDKTTGQPVPDIRLEIHPVQLENITMGRAMSVEDGRYFLRANPGTYKVVLKQVSEGNAATVIGTAIVKVGSERVVNRKILI